MVRVVGNIKDLGYAIIDGCLQREHVGFRREDSNKSFGKNQMDDTGQRPAITAFGQPGRYYGNVKEVLCNRQQSGG